MVNYKMEVTEGSAVINLEIEGKVYSETWRAKCPGIWGTDSKGIASQLEDDGVEVSEELIEAIEEQDPCDLLDAIISNT